MGEILYGTWIQASGVDLSWLSGRRIVGVEWHDPSPWTFSFDDGSRIHVQCLWRIVKDSAFALSSEDHHQKYGLATPIDAVADSRALLSDRTVDNVWLRSETVDLALTFSGGLLLEIISLFGGYECWQITGPDGQFYVGMAAAGVSKCEEKT